jgi:dCTP diphosphatase|tara:strand:+ start:157 stop:513 length:357 start_codon:yes stop_codon:yes gene_type:complete
VDSLEKLKLAMRKFAAERDWEQFHSPKNLVMALSGEAGELTECFQWLSEEQSQSPNDTQLAAIADEVADVQLYLVRLADKLNLDIAKECVRKIQHNAKNYPIDKSKGSAKKYTEYFDS